MDMSGSTNYNTCSLDGHRRPIISPCAQTRDAALRASVFRWGGRRIPWLCCVGPGSYISGPNAHREDFVANQDTGDVARFVQEKATVKDEKNIIGLDFYVKKPPRPRCLG